MRCLECGGETKVIQTRNYTPEATYRRRKCLTCGYRFSTEERVKDAARLVRAIRARDV